MKAEVTTRIEAALRDVARARGVEGDLPAPSIERPKKPEHGDFATNVALVLSKRAGCKPQELAAELKARLSADPMFASVDVAGPGFLNLKLSPRAFHATVVDVVREGTAFGRARAATGERINLEFVSANPTGPLHMAHGRGAVTGDVVGRLLEAMGHRVVREYYVNDAGNQVKLLVDSVVARARGRDVPEGGYGGAYVTELSTYAVEHHSDLVDAVDRGGDFNLLAGRLVAAMLGGYGKEGGIQGTLNLLGIDFDVWSSEAALHGDGRVGRALGTLRKGGYLEDRDGALFFASTRLGDDKDRVVYKSDGGHTYFASDIAYHADKLDRGYDRLIDVWGADHHGYIPRMKAALSALGLAADRFEVILVQMVSLLKNGQPYRMGKRLGNFITLDEVVEEIDEAAGRKGAGRDALRYFFVSRRAEAQLDIDVEIAKKQSLDNPVFYVQVGHARLCSILRIAKDECGLDVEGPVDEASLAPLVHPDELAIVAKLAEWPGVMREASALREPHRVVGYVNDLSQAFQSYYTRLKKEGDTVLPRTPERADGSFRTRDGGAYLAKVRARVAWIRAIRDVSAAALGLLGITAPERMERPAGAPSGETAAEDDA